MGKLTAKQVEKAPAGRHWDDAGLTLQVAAGGSKQWLLRYALRGKTREMGLGAYPRVSLKGARQEATEIKNQCAERIDPLVEKRKAEAAKRAARTFREAATEFAEDHKATWSPRRAENWLNGMAIHLFETLRRRGHGVVVRGGTRNPQWGEPGKHAVVPNVLLFNGRFPRHQPAGSGSAGSPHTPRIPPVGPPDSPPLHQLGQR